MPIDKATKKTVIFILQADTESIQKQQRDSFEKGNSVHNITSEHKVSVQTSTQKRFDMSIKAPVLTQYDPEQDLKQANLPC